MEEGYREISQEDRKRYLDIVHKGFDKEYPEQAMVDDLLDEGLQRPQAEEIVFSVYGNLKKSESKYATKLLVSGTVLTIVGLLIIIIALQISPNRFFKITALPLISGLGSLLAGGYLKFRH